jgi:hypothetical protein
VDAAVDKQGMPKSPHPLLARADPYAVAAGGLGLAYFLFTYPSRVLNIFNLDWMMQGDRAYHGFGWLFFRNSAWSFPLGNIDGYLHPIHSSIAYTGSIPWLAVPMRLLIGWIDAPTQFAGPWLALCFILMGVFGYLIAGEFVESRRTRLLIAAFFPITPMILRRAGHMTLAAHFMLLWGMWLYIRAQHSASCKRFLIEKHLLAFLACSSHPYLAAMVLPLLWAVVARMRLVDRTISTRRAGVLVFSLTGISCLTFLLFGYHQGGALGALAGFGQYSADLLTLFNPMGMSQWLPSYDVNHGQYEGFAYLGTGILLLSLPVIAFAMRRMLGGGSGLPCAVKSGVAAYIPLLVVVVGAFLFSLASPIYVARTPLLDLDGLYGNFEWMTTVFRASGRFAWLACYVVMGLVLIGVSRVFPPKLAQGLLCAALLIQIVDLRPLIDGDRGRRVGPFVWNTLQSEQWQQVIRGKQAISLMPPQIQHFQCPGASLWPKGAYIPFAALAVQNGMRINSGGQARLGGEVAAAACRAAFKEVATGLDPNTVYVVAPEVLPKFRIRAPLAQCEVIEGYNICAVPN